ncbi:hypothetical protein AMTR_s00071p00185000 [Amborella trichopoda]|uniref:MULE transposase domain-containing protein n=1 Tax=Amborella trichopoda TaxID=13333 RepID=U5DCX2_AMBTC|nr:hypothetical protein AMTR_s00071p00185000 [Amborella trichopoda]
MDPIAAVGVDVNENIFPKTNAAVESENTPSWTWFLKLLNKQFDERPDLPVLTIISDRQKGLKVAIEKVSGLPCSHAIVAIDHRHEDVTKFCGVYLTVQMYRRSYSFPFNLIPNTLELSDIVYTTVIPPTARRTAGRLKKRRKQTEYKESRPPKCSRCGVVGHNRNTCN